MKKKTFVFIIILFTIVISSCSSLCMEEHNREHTRLLVINRLKELIIIKTDSSAKYLKKILKRATAGNYTTIERDVQYEVLKTCIDANNTKCLQLCFTYKFYPNPYRRGLSLLHYAIERNNTDALWELAEANADLVPLNSSEETPLHYAKKLNYQQCINTMIHLIKIRRNHLKLSQKPCGLIKHIINPERPCTTCINELSDELERYSAQITTSHEHSTVTGGSSESYF